MLQEFVGLFAQFFSLYCATNSQTFDCKIKPRASEQNFFLKAEICLFFIFCLTNSNFFMCNIWVCGVGRSEEQSPTKVDYLSKAAVVFHHTHVCTQFFYFNT